MTRTCLTSPLIVPVGPSRTHTTRQAAWNWAQQTLDLCGQPLTFQSDAGLCNDDFTAVGPLVGGCESTIVFRGDPAVPDNCVIDANTSCFGATDGACYYVSGFKVTSGNGNCLAAGPGSRLVFGSIDFGQTDLNHIAVWAGGLITGDGTNYVISGGANAHYKLDSWGTIIVNPCAVWLPKPCAFTYFCQAGTGSACFKNLSFSGPGAGIGSTGAKYAVNEGATVLVGGAGTEYFPGYANSGQIGDGRYE